MRNKFIEIQNFRKLKSIRIDFSKQTTVLVGANNSGKTSAMVALSHFLIDHDCFDINDITLSNWNIINNIGKRWENATKLEEIEAEITEWHSLLPAIDVWLDVPPNEVYYVSDLLPTLDWSGGLLGVRLRLEPKEIAEFYKEYILARNAAIETLATAKSLRLQKITNNEEVKEFGVNLWPADMKEFLERKLRSILTIRSYTLNPAKLCVPNNGIAIPQELSESILPLDFDPFKSLIRIDKIDAHRGFSNLVTKGKYGDPNDTPQEKGKLSDQLRTITKIILILQQCQILRMLKLWRPFIQLNRNLMLN